MKGDDKYSVDYGRFDRIAEEADEPAKDDRDYYYDEKGNRVPLGTAAPKPEIDPKAEEAFSAEMKDFLDKAQDVAGEGKGGTDMKGFLNKASRKEKARDIAREMRAQGAQEAKKPDAREVPQYVITRSEKVQVVVTLPLVSSMKAVELDVAAETLRLASPEYLLECKLPCAVDAASTNAKFKKTTKELVVTIPPAA